MPIQKTLNRFVRIENRKLCLQDAVLQQFGVKYHIAEGLFRLSRRTWRSSSCDATQKDSTRPWASSITQTAFDRTPSQSEISLTIIANTMEKHVYLVHASPGAFKSGMPEMASIKDDFPELCEPITTMRGRSMSMSNLLVSIRRQR
jgi:hypothetical protein